MAPNVEEVQEGEVSDIARWAPDAVPLPILLTIFPPILPTATSPSHLATIRLSFSPHRYAKLFAPEFKAALKKAIVNGGG